MPKYFFDLNENGICRPDEFGVELDHSEEARDQAMAILPDLAREEAPSGDDYIFICTGLDDKRRVIYRGTLVYRGEWVRLNDGIAGQLG